MRRVVSRTTIAVAGLAISLAISVGIYLLTDSLFVFLFVPFVPLLLGRGREPSVRRCPVCGYETTDHAYEYCPRDGTALERSRE
ncbi:hypothetical protein [Halorarius litoreus]|uniref:hypothetical protein n=1 Tax=Halorarius litoreus TaxID=2962676 RepID=UPI0020CEF993|nr:hypothetical protein [Halorarius litoreus]